MRPQAWERSCHRCEHLLWGPSTSVCEVFEETIYDWRAAALDCPAYEPQELP